MAIRRSLSVAVAVLLAAGVGFGTGYVAHQPAVGPSSPPPTAILVPKVVGLDVPGATAVLRSADLSVGTVRQESSIAPDE